MLAILLKISNFKKLILLKLIQLIFFWTKVSATIIPPLQIYIKITRYFSVMSWTKWLKERLTVSIYCHITT